MRCCKKWKHLRNAEWKDLRLSRDEDRFSMCTLARVKATLILCQSPSRDEVHALELLLDLTKDTSMQSLSLPWKLTSYQRRQKILFLDFDFNFKMLADGPKQPYWKIKYKQYNYYMHFVAEYGWIAKLGVLIKPILHKLRSIWCLMQMCGNN